ncbi:MAG: hypothetical protein PVF78_10195 [Desulfobacterales bacterium]|jgi:hypothetical protein
MKNNSAESSPAAGRYSLRISLFLFLIFFVNLLVGKCNVAFHWGLPHLESVPEFLLLGAASIMLVLAALRREAAEIENTKQNAKEV